MGIRIDISAQTPLSDDDREILASHAELEQADDETEGLEPAPCGSPSRDEPTRYCIREPGHSGRHRYRTRGRLAN